MEPIVLVHGGAGDIPVSRVKGKVDGSKKAANIGYKALIATNDVVTAVEEAVKSMELDDYFNAGYGSVLTRDGTIEMEASLMTSQGGVGCVSLVKDIYHPISLARRVMDLTPHNYLAGDTVNQFAKDQGFEILAPGTLITPYAIASLEEWKREEEQGPVKFARTEVVGEVGTVGAVAIDRNGNIAVATSTGGITGKYQGRIGDTPVIGAGTYCNEFVGISTTGHGETIMRSTLAHDVAKRMEYLKVDVQRATKDACEDMTRRFEGEGGAISIAKGGDVGIAFTSQRMSWAYRKNNQMFFGIERDEFNSETVAE